jgi:hypothetical protein
MKEVAMYKKDFKQKYFLYCKPFVLEVKSFKDFNINSSTKRITIKEV